MLMARMLLLEILEYRGLEDEKMRMMFLRDHKDENTTLL
jgi:hypothetical protein